MNFNIGDRIAVVNVVTASLGYDVGDCGVVIRIGGLGSGCEVRFDNGRTSYLYNREMRKLQDTPPSTPKLDWLTLVGEQKRTYHFPGGETFTVERVTHVAVRPTNHRLQTADGRKFIVPGKFVAIEIDAQEWSA